MKHVKFWLLLLSPNVYACRHGNKLKESKDGVHRPLIVKFKHLKDIAIFIILSCTSLVFNILEFQ